MEWQAVSSWFAELDDWKPVSRAAAWFALASYFFYANLAIHEAGHPLFGMFAGPEESGVGYTLEILGGTLLELMVPAACAAAFFFRRELPGMAFCLFWLFENLLYIGHYMATARTLDIQLVGSGEHDWEILFTRWSILVHDQQIGQATRALGWLGMLATVAWFARRSFGRPAL